MKTNCVTEQPVLHQAYLTHILCINPNFEHDRRRLVIDSHQSESLLSLSFSKITDE